MANDPGSPEAEKAGCLCPPMDNGHGSGYRLVGDNDTLFVISVDCPLHGHTEERIEDIIDHGEKQDEPGDTTQG